MPSKRTPGIRRLRSAAIALLALLAVFVMTACSDASPNQSKLQVVTTNNIVADWVRNVGGDTVEVFSLLPVGADPHNFQPGARDVTRIADADLVLSVGLGLEGAWLRELVQNAARDPATVIELGEGVDPIEFAATHAGEVEFLEALDHVVHEVEAGEITPEEGIAEISELASAGAGEEALTATVLEIIRRVEEGKTDTTEAIEAIEGLTAEGEAKHKGHGHGLEDPHFWFDPTRVQIAVNDVAGRLGSLDPDRMSDYLANADAFNRQLAELDEWTMGRVDAVPVERRLLVTSHDSFGYFALRYGFTVVGVVFGATTEAEPSPAGLAELAETAEEYRVPAIFGETTVTERLAQAIAEESGSKLVRLYSGSLGEAGSGAESYTAMVRTNVERIVEALQRGLSPRQEEE